jgi:hypothetical protein
MNHFYIKISAARKQCSRCNIIEICWADNIIPKFTYHFVNKSGIIKLQHELSCSEMIIKNIIE